MEKQIMADKTQASEQVRLLGVLLDLKNKELTIHDNQKEILVQQNRLQKTRLDSDDHYFHDHRVCFHSFSGCSSETGLNSRCSRSNQPN